MKRLLAASLTLLSLLSGGPVLAAIALDNSAHAVTAGGNFSSLSFTQTVGAGSNRVLIVGVSLHTRNATVSSVTYGGAALTQAGTIATGSNANRTDIWYLLSPAPTSNGAIVVTPSTSTAISAGSLSFTGVEQSAPAFASATASTGSASVTVANAAGDVIIDTISANGDAGTLTPGSSQTSRWNEFSGSSGNGNEVISAGSTQAGAVSTTMTWSLSGGNKPWSLGAVTLVPASVSPSFLNLKTVAISSDPVNGTTNPKYIPGAVALYTIQITNSGAASPDNNSVTVVDAVPAHTTLYVGDLNGANSGPVHFVDGSSASGLTYTYSGLSSSTDSIDFSNNGGTSYGYTPTPDGNGYDANVTNIRISPQGTFAAAGAGNPSFQISFRVKVN
jgi:uncharacterized repeat protein (TIGR01451 family)